MRAGRCCAPRAQGPSARAWLPTLAAASSPKPAPAPLDLQHGRAMLLGIGLPAGGHAAYMAVVGIRTACCEVKTVQWGGAR